MIHITHNEFSDHVTGMCSVHNNTNVYIIIIKGNNGSFLFKSFVTPFRHVQRVCRFFSSIHFITSIVTLLILCSYSCRLAIQNVHKKKKKIYITKYEQRRTSKQQVAEILAIMIVINCRLYLGIREYRYMHVAMRPFNNNNKKFRGTQQCIQT